MWERKYIIWSNENLDTEDWKESFKEYIEMNNLDIDPKKSENKVTSVSAFCEKYKEQESSTNRERE